MATQSFVQDAAGRQEHINKALKALADRETQVLSSLLDLSNPVKAIKHEWVDDTLFGFKDSLAAALTSSTTTVITVNSGTDNPKRYLDGFSLLYMEDEVVLVSSTITIVTNSSTLCITRAQKGTTASSHPNGTQVIIIGAPQNEGFDANRDDSEFGTRFYNYTQIFDRQLKLSGSSQHIIAVGDEPKIGNQLEKKMSEIMKELQLSLFHGRRAATSASDFKDRTMGGFRYWADQSGNVEDAGNAAINKSMIEDVIEDYLNRGGDANKLCILTSVKQQRKLNELKESLVQGNVGQGERSLDFYWNTYNFGTRANIKVMYSTDIFDNEMYFFQKDLVKVRPLGGRAFQRQKLAKTGDNEREMIVGEYTVEFRNIYETLYRYKNLKTS